MLRRSASSLLLVALAFGVSSGDDATQVDGEVQKRIESALRKEYAPWGLTADRWARSGVRVVGSQRSELLEIRTWYMASPTDAKRRLESFEHTIAGGPGPKIPKVGDAAYLSLDRSAILRFRQNSVVVEVTSKPDSLAEPTAEKLSLEQREGLVRRVAKLAEGAIVGPPKR